MTKIAEPPVVVVAPLQRRAFDARARAPVTFALVPGDHRVADRRQLRRSGLPAPGAT